MTRASIMAEVGPLRHAPAFWLSIELNASAQTPIGSGVGLNWPKYLGLGTPIAFGAISSRKRARISSSAIPFSGRGSSKSFSRSAGVASGVTRRFASPATCWLIISATAGPKKRCCSTKSSIMIYALDMNRFEQSLISNMGSFDLDLSAETITLLDKYYSLLTRWNDRLHLVAPCSPEEFATRHVLESLLLLKHLPQNAKIADIGSGAGLPIIPCLIARPDLNSTLIESSQKKAVFLREALNAVGRNSAIVPRPFEEVEPPDVSFVTCRALDQFMNKVSALIDWAPAASTLLLFGGETLAEQLRSARVKFEQFLIPKSEKRFLFLTTD